MAFILWRWNHETIVTIGDAIKSFIQTPDATTEDCCLVSGHDIRETWETPPETRTPQRFRELDRESWSEGASGKRWVLFELL